MIYITSFYGSATIQRVTQPVILLRLFQVVIQQNKNHLKYFPLIFQWHCLVVTVSDW